MTIRLNASHSSTTQRHCFFYTYELSYNWENQIKNDLTFNAHLKQAIFRFSLKFFKAIDEFWFVLKYLTSPLSAQKFIENSSFITNTRRLSFKASRKQECQIEAFEVLLFARLQPSNSFETAHNNSKHLNDQVEHYGHRNTLVDTWKQNTRHWIDSERSGFAPWLE